MHINNSISKSVIKTFILFSGVFTARSLQGQIIPASTSIPAFIGYTEKAIDFNGNDLSGTPRMILNFNDYLRYFGGEEKSNTKKVILSDDNNVLQVDNSKFLLFNSVRLYFLNGGRPCYIVSIGKYNSPADKTDFIRGLDSLRNYDEPTLLLFPDAVNLPGNDLYEVQKAALLQAGTLGDRFCIFDLKFADSKHAHEAVIIEFRNNIGTEYLDFGSAYSPYLKITSAFSLTYSDWKEALMRNNIPVRLRDLTSDSLIREKIDELEAAILSNQSFVKNLEYELNLLFPLMKKINQQLNQFEHFIPPSGIVAGNYCRNDEIHGVWRSPAGIENTISYTGKPAYSILPEAETYMSGTNKGNFINPIKYFTSRGTVIWGARTLSNNSEWRYITIRRFINYIDESIKKTINKTNFPDYSPQTWTEIKRQTDQFLYYLFRKGALQGNTPAEAYFVKLGPGETMTTTDVNEKRLIIIIGLAVQRRAEFITRKYVFEMQ